MLRFFIIALTAWHHVKTLVQQQSFNIFFSFIHRSLLHEWLGFIMFENGGIKEQQSVVDGGDLCSISKVHLRVWGMYFYVLSSQPNLIGI